MIRKTSWANFFRTKVVDRDGTLDIGIKNEFNVEMRPLSGHSIVVDFRSTVAGLYKANRLLTDVDQALQGFGRLTSLRWWVRELK